MTQSDSDPASLTPAVPNSTDPVSAAVPQNRSVFARGLLAGLALSVAIGTIVVWVGSTRFSDAALPMTSEAASGSTAQFTPATDAARAEVGLVLDDTRRETCFVGAVVAGEAVDVAAEIAGVIDSLDVRLGDRVEAGQVIASLDTRALQHQLDTEHANLRSAQAQKRRFAIEAERTADEHQRRVALSGLLSREDEEKARYQHEAAIASLEEASAELSRVAARIAGLKDDIERSRLRAPFAGSVALRYLDPGARASAGTPIVHLLGSDDLLVRFAMPAKNAYDLKAGDALRVETVEPRRTFDAIVEHLAPEIDPASLMLIVEARLEEAPEVDVPFGSEARVSPKPPAGHGVAHLASCLEST